MTVIGVGDLKMADGAQFPGIVIEASRDELVGIAGNVLYREVFVEPIKPGKKGKPTIKSVFGKMFGEFVERLCAVDKRVRAEKESRMYSRDEVLALLDEIDPEGRESGVANG